MYCLSCLLLHLKNDNRCPLCRANIEDSESSDESSEDENIDTTTYLNNQNLYRYEINGVVSINYNLKMLFYILLFSIQYNVIMFLLFMNKKHI
jgi:hypothetical protein